MFLKFSNKFFKRMFEKFLQGKSKIEGFENFNFSLIIYRSVDCKIPITCIARTIILFWPRFFGHIETEKFLKFLRKTAIFKGLKRQAQIAKIDRKIFSWG